MTAASLVLGIAYVAFAALSVFLAVHDIRTHRLPNAVVLPAYPLAIAMLALACVLGAEWSRLLTALAGMIVLFGFYVVLRLVNPRGMGGGDVKLAGLVGLMLGWVGWGALALGALAGFVLGGLYGVALLAAGRADRGTAIPFGPWMLAGAWAGIAAGPALAAWLLSSGG